MQTTQLQIGDFVERTAGDARNRGNIIEIAGDRARIQWTHRQKYENHETSKLGRWKQVWTGEFTPMTARAPRTWTSLKTLKRVQP